MSLSFPCSLRTPNSSSSIISHSTKELLLYYRTNPILLYWLLFIMSVLVSLPLEPLPLNAGILSGFSGLESVPGPQLPQIDFLKQWNDENQKKYAENDARFKSSSVLKELLEKSRLNKERNQRETQDKYCLRGAEWGVGDCSTQGMTQEDRDEFVSMLKKRAGGD
ncbi:hypothetical protein ZIOFF_009918 [Zingiber officinale]|uniref:Uncharacterized protein n=1 Tax=Zingiber officinale TaxID=94328 RepID=A0A8J5HLI8_ZINOF|nr:hypothetical protein ZIOFF_009918 [Zingiber officinale]